MNLGEPAPEQTVHAIAIVGTGFSGLGMAIRLQQEGIHDFVLLEKAADLGGTWRDNRYPGCACDVQSHLYSFSFEPNPEWSRMFSPQPEIWDYLRRCADKHGLAPHIRYNSELVQARWDEAAALWRLHCADGSSLSARVLISGMGGLSRPAMPEGIPGLERFQGHSFHSQQWDESYDLAGKRVAVIGTGASAIQFVPQIRKTAARVDLYQRTPPWILPRPDRRIGDFEHRLFRALPWTQRLFRGAIYLLMESRAYGFVVDPRVMKLAEKMARAHLRRQVADPELRARLTPDYVMGCKRVLISNDYYPALAQPNVELITAGIAQVREHSIVTADGKEREVDAIIFGTGFRATDPVSPGTLFGRGGRDIVDAWKDGPEAYKGTTVAGFPNLFLLTGPNTGLGHNSMVYMIESQFAYVLDALATMRRQGAISVEVQPQAQQRFNGALQQRLQRAVWNRGGCRSWYLHPNGKNVTLWPGFTWQFRRALRRFDAEAYVLEKGPLPKAVERVG
jgi:cation diffusion facilitator CzcD-associated flavoprotein CzcO